MDLPHSFNSRVPLFKEVCHALLVTVEFGDGLNLVIATNNITNFTSPFLMLLPIVEIV